MAVPKNETCVVILVESVRKCRVDKKTNGVVCCETTHGSVVAFHERVETNLNRLLWKGGSERTLKIEVAVLFFVELENQSMQFDVVQEMQARVETPVASRLERAEGDVECLKRDSKALSDDTNEKLGKLQQYTLDSILRSAMRYASTLKDWTGKTRATKIYDSTVDEFTHGRLFNKVKGKRNVAVVGFTTVGDVFGGFYSVAVTEQNREFDDPTIFAFSFESRGRCATPQRFVVKERLKEKTKVVFLKDTNGLIDFWVDGVGGFNLGNERSNSYCWNMSNVFEGLENKTLTGKSGLGDEDAHHCTRLVAIQLE